ncbi:MAG: flippase-like domain-containing protein, partial [Alcaligenaceae bacterium]|nr:flippase-like domain-containing protein [Alcaligenaceae bacterium]
MNKKKYITLVYIAINILIIAVIGLLDPHLKDIGWAFYQLKPVWIGMAALCMILFWIMDTLIIKYLLASIHGSISFKKSIVVALIGQYYNAVTPFASGGQPMQIYYMSRFGIPAGYSTSVLIIKFLMYQIVLSILCIPALLFKSRFILSYSWVVFTISLIGFIINAG